MKRWIPLICLAACSSPAARPASLEATAGDAAAPAATPAPAVPPPAAATPRPALHTHLRGPGALVIENQGATPVRLAHAIRIERKTATGWEPTGVDLGAFETCPAPAASADACVELGPGAVLRPKPWTGYFGCTQCEACRGNAPAAAGTYRFVVSTCDHQAELPSDLSILEQPGVITGPPWAD